MTSAAAGAAVRCGSCRAEIWWGVTRNGRPIPLDTVPTDTGNVVIEGRTSAGVTVRVLGRNAERPANEPVYMPHFATCSRGLRVIEGDRS